MSLIIGIDDDRETQRADLGEKIRELCEALLADENVSAARGRVESFLSNPSATAGYAALAQRSQELQQKEQSGLTVTEEEIEEFETMRRNVFSDPQVQSFMDARGLLQEVEALVMAYVSRTLELGRVPSDEELMPSGGGCCGDSCGCHH